MAQSLNLAVALGPSKTGLAVGYRLLNLNGTTQAAFTTTNVVEASTPGTFVVTVPVSVADAGARIVWGISGTDYLEGVIDAVPAVNLATGAITAAVVATGAIDADAIATDAVTEIQSGLATAAALTTVAGYIDTEVAAIKAKTDNLPPAPAAVSDIPSTSAIATAVWANATRSLTTFGTLASDVWAVATRTITGGTVTTNSDKTGYSLSSAGIQAIWDALTSALTVVGSIGKRIADNLDATITSRMATFTYTTPPTVAAIRTEMDTNSTKLANLDATVSSRAAAATALSTAQWTNTRAGNLDNLNATISSRATPADVTTAQAAIEAAITALNDLSTADIAAALATYNGATQTDLDSAIASLQAILEGLGLVPMGSAPLPNVAGALTVVAATTFEATLTGLVIPSTWTAVRFTVKKGNTRTDDDSTAILQIVERNPGTGSDGLVVLNGATTTAAWAALTVNQAAGSVVVRIEDDATAELEPTTYLYDVKVFYGSSESLTHQGSIAVMATATQTV